MVKKGKTRSYKIERAPGKWPTRLVRPPSIHIVYEHFIVDDQPVPGMIAVVVLWVLNNYDALKRAGTGVYFYIPKMQTPREALVVEKLLARMEGIIGVSAGTFKLKMLYEEGNAGRYLPAIAWVFRRRLLGTNVGRWDYLGSLIEMWKDDPDGVFPDPQTIGMASPNMIAYQQYNALLMLMAGMKHGELTQGAPIGGMAAVMMYQASDGYGRSRYNPVAMRAIVVDKLRERLLGLMIVPDDPKAAARQVTLDDILAVASRGGFTTHTGKAGWPVRSRYTWLREIDRCNRRWRNCRQCWMRPARRWTQMAKPSPRSPAAWPSQSGRCWNRAAC